LRQLYGRAPQEVVLSFRPIYIGTATVDGVYCLVVLRSRMFCCIWGKPTSLRWRDIDVRIHLDCTASDLFDAPFLVRMVPLLPCLTFDPGLGCGPFVGLPTRKGRIVPSQPTKSLKNFRLKKINLSKTYTIGI